MLFDRRSGCRDPIDLWNFRVCGCSQTPESWGANQGRDTRVRKAQLLSQIQELDRRADSSGLQEDQWALRYHLEDQLLNIVKIEEEYWRQRGRRNWLLKGDANTAYFHAFANGRRRKCNILSLMTTDGPITDKRAIQEHIYSFYLDLFASDSPSLLSLRRNFWCQEHCVSTEENLALSLSFLPQELEEVLRDTKTDTAPGRIGRAHV